MQQPDECGVCGKHTEKECSHVDCSNRRRVTAQPIGWQTFTRGIDREGRSLPGTATIAGFPTHD